MFNFYFFSRLPSSSARGVLGPGIRGLFGQVERDPEEAESADRGWSPPSLSLPVPLTPLRLPAAPAKLAAAPQSALPGGIFHSKAPLSSTRNRNGGFNADRLAKCLLLSRAKIHFDFIFKIPAI